MSILPDIRWEVTGEDYMLEVLHKLEAEVRDESRFLVRIADEVLASEAAASLERAREIPLSTASLERRRRPKWKRWHAPAVRHVARPGKQGKQGKRRTDPPPTGRDAEFMPSTGATTTTEAALTSRFVHHYRSTGDAVYSPVALREVHGGVLYWGSKRWVSRWIGYHMQLVAPTQRMPARIDFMTGDSRTEIVEQVPQVVTDEIFQALERAGAPDEWLDETRIEQAVLR